MEEKFTIGEVAALLNISPQTLRFYDKSGIVVPHFTDPKTGYRYYGYDQIYYINRIKYLQHFGFRLEDIRSALAGNDVEVFKEFLLQQQKHLRKEVSRLNDLLSELDGYVEYYDHIDYRNATDLPYKTREPERYLLAEPLEPGEDIYGTAGRRLTKLQHSEPFSKVRFFRQNGYLLDFEALLRGELRATHYFVYLREMPDFSHPQLMKIPAGLYFCTQSRILAEPFPYEHIRRYFPGEQPPRLVAANEYEDNFENFKDCVYETQILLSVH